MSADTIVARARAKSDALQRAREAGRPAADIETLQHLADQLGRGPVVKECVAALGRQLNQGRRFGRSTEIPMALV